MVVVGAQPARLKVLVQRHLVSPLHVCAHTRGGVGLVGAERNTRDCFLVSQVGDTE